MAPTATATKTDRELEDKMLAFADDRERIDVIGKARVFKRSWIELAEALSGVAERTSWKRWGHESFEAYCKKELRITPSTASKLLGSFRFLRTSAPQVLERARVEEAAPVPDLRVVDFVARAEKRGAVDKKTMNEIHRDAFEEGVTAPLLSKRYKEVAFPVSNEQRTQKLHQQVTTAARRLASLIADPDLGVPHGVAVAVEEALGQLLEVLDSDGDRAAAN